MSMAYALILSEMKTKFTAMGSNTGETHTLCPTPSYINYSRTTVSDKIVIALESYFNTLSILCL